jgi:hypothetical protein
MTKRADWEKFFDGHAPVYMDNSFTKNTVNEVDFLIEELRLKRRTQAAAELREEALRWTKETRPTASLQPT